MAAEEIIGTWFAAITVIFASLGNHYVFSGFSFLTCFYILIALEVILWLIDKIRAGNSRGTEDNK